MQFRFKLKDFGSNAVSLFSGSAIASLLFVVPGASANDLNPDMLQAVSELYGITQEQAIDRLARETEAALTLHTLQLQGIENFAGSWFDAESGKLVIAVSDAGARDQIQGANVEAVLVQRNLKELQLRLDDAVSTLRASRQDSAVVSQHVDVQSNEVVLTVVETSLAAVSSTLGNELLTDGVRIESTATLPELSTGLVRAATGTRNLTWAGQYGGEWPCSVGASVEDGFITAGHCGSAQGTTPNQIGDSSGAPLGHFEESAWFAGNPSIDSAYVQTGAGWTPSGTVQGYSDGIFPVASDWGGIVQFGIGTTVCRYGQTSGGPHCGTIDAMDVDIVPTNGGGQTIVGTTRVNGGCSDDGDSGGPWVASTGFIQGTNVGEARHTSDTGSCPTQAVWTYFQPITDALVEFDDHDLVVLTGHGANAPSLENVECPVAGLGGPGLFSCNTGVVDSQGKPSVQWSGSSGIKPGPVLTETCTVGQTVYVTAQATNTYGTTTKYYSFPCPSF